METQKGFIKDWAGRNILPITRGELVLDQDGNIALNSKYFLAGENGSQYGLITAAEREMLKGEGSGGGIADIYTKLGYINAGLSFGNVGLKFYDDAGTATPIKIISSGDGKIDIAVTGQAVNFSLAELTTDGITATNIIKGLKVDKYGRVTEVTSDTLKNGDIPAELTGKTLKDGTLDGYKTAAKEIANDELAVANKAYVDLKFNSVNAAASGALKLHGPISDADAAETALTDQNFWNKFFKVTAEFELPVSDLLESSGISGTKLKVKIGDTLIVYPPTTGTRSKFLYIPSGDDITTITVKGDGEAAAALNGAIGDVSLRFSNIFSVTNTTGGNTAYISIPPASNTQHGYLSKEDYITFKNYANSLSVSYAGEFESGNGVYKIGTLTLGSTEKVIYGKNNISALVLNSGATNEYNPILKFTETGATDVEITFTGLNGIKTKKNGNTIEIGAANEIVEQTVPSTTTKVKYLTVDNGCKFGVQIGEVDAEGNIIQHGLTDFSQFINLVSKVRQTTRFEVFEYSLKGSESTTEYRYGNQLLIDAIELATI
jgi:hypothetical protein